MSCKYCRKSWVEADNGEVYVMTCMNEDCFEYQSDTLDIQNCSEEGCIHFEKGD